MPKLTADVVLMDLNLPGINGTECIRQAKAVRPEIQFMVLSVLDGPAYVFNALKTGATGYLLKAKAPLELAEAVRNIQAGGPTDEQWHCANGRGEFPVGNA